MVRVLAVLAVSFWRIAFIEPSKETKKNSEKLVIRIKTWICGDLEIRLIN